MRKRAKITFFSTLIIIFAVGIAILLQRGTADHKDSTERDESVLIDMVLKHAFWGEYDPKPPPSAQIEKILSIMTDPNGQGVISIVGRDRSTRRGTEACGELRWQPPNPFFIDCLFISIDLDREGRLTRQRALGLLLIKMDQACWPGDDDW